ncbi:leucine-rich repeat protein [[Ruminococcus] torques]|uniref:leucine-rich repeat protein n=1 Tax=[Ruminococcus] torques TaxID=33039 RepID=UPI0026DA89DA|nr:leucine-rich repeat protein [[Ruminococcus] torques]
MITKFERKVIAGLTAFLMCLSMIFAVPVSVNAEAERTQDEAVSGVQQNETVKDVQIPDGMSENVPHDIIAGDEAGDVPHDITVGDEASEKVQQDTVEAGGAAKEKEDQPTAPYEDETRTPQMLNVDQQEEVAGTITLKKDGTPEYGEAAFSTEQTMVRYRLNIEEDGQYYFGLIKDWNVSAYVSLFERTEEGDNYLSNGSYSYELRKDGNYYLEIEKSSEEALETLKWYAGKVRDIKPGEFEAELSENVEEICYNLTVDETGWYRFSYDALSMSVEDKETGEYISSWSFCKLEQGHTYYITVSNRNVNGALSNKWSVKKGKAIPVELEQVYRNENLKDVYYVFVPETTGKYVVKERSNIYDETWKNIEDKNGSAQMTVGNSYYITVDGAQYWSIQKYVESEQETITVQEGKTYTTPLEGQRHINYTFTPDETGVYRFKSPQNDRYLHIKDENKITGFGTKSGKINYFVALEKGKTYEFSISGYGPSEASWNITKASVKAVEVGKEYTTTEDETTVYDFVPSKSGEYMFSSKDAGTGKVYSSDWKEIDGYWYNGAVEFGVKVSLEQGKTYHVGVALLDQDAKWKIEQVKESSDYTYRVLSDNTVEILKYSGAESNVTVPDKIDNKVVKCVGYGAFAENENIVGVTIPAQVTDLQYGVFASCANLETVTFKAGSKLQKIAARAFENCSKLQSISLPDSVQTIEENGFAYCKNLGAVDFGNVLKEIDNYAFCDSGVTRVRIPNSTTAVGASAFSGCDSLNEVTLGSGLKGIERGVFSNCSNLKQIEIPDNITYISDEAFMDAGLTSVEIPDSVTSIGFGAFYGCESLKKVVIGNNLAYIADNAFTSCALTEIMWGGKVEKIGTESFSNNKNLTTVSIPNSVTEIEYGAFNRCDNLSNVEIPDSVEAIGGFAFDNEGNDTRSTNTKWYDAQADGDVYAGKVYYKYKGEAPADTVVTIKDGTKGIAGYAFYMQKNLKEVVIPDSVNNIGEVAFMGCESLKTVTIPESVKVIGREAFGYLSSEKWGQGYKVEGFTIRGVAGSAAEKYAKENGFTFEAIKPDYIKGDSDSDGKVTISDVRTTLRYVCRKVELNETQKLAADVEKDGTIDIKDLRKVLRFVCDKIEEL